jgi:hypothetical protein
MKEIVNKIDFDVDHTSVEKRKERIRKIWNYESVDHVPLGLYVLDNNAGFSRQEIEKEKEKNLKFDLDSIKKSFELLKDDYIPFLKPETGCASVPSILGCRVDYTEGFSNFSTVKEPIILNASDLENITIPVDEKEIIARGLMPLNLEKISYYHDIAGDTFDTTGIDIGGVMCGSADIMDTEFFYMSFITEKDRMLAYLEKLSELYLKVYTILVNKIGGLKKMTNVEWDVSWYPEGRKGYVSDDPCANFGPDTFEVFSKPFSKKIYDRFGYGGFHNCGPHPCASRYLDYSGNSLKAVNCSLKCTYSQLDSFMDNFTGREVVLYFLIEEEYYDCAKAVQLYNELAEKGAKRNLVCIPSYALDASIHSGEEIKQTFDEFFKISGDYCKSLKLK